MQTVIIPSVGGPSIDLAISAWLDAKLHKSGSTRTAHEYGKTLATFRQILQRVSLDLDGQAEVIALAAQAWAFRRSDGVTSVTGSTANQRLAILSSFYAFAARRRLLLDAEGRPLANPIYQIERAVVQGYANARPLTAEAVTDALAAIDRSTLTGGRDYALLALALETGHRAQELRTLTRGDLLITTSRHGELVNVTWRRVKGGKVMHSDLTADTSAALLTWLAAFYGADLGTLAPDAPLFVSLAHYHHGGMLSRQALADIWLARLGTSKIHTTRHTFAFHMEESGAKVSEIQELLGHADISTTGKYLHSMHNGQNPYANDLAGLFGIGGKSPRSGKVTRPLHRREHD